jgi:hypothetical protein
MKSEGIGGEELGSEETEVGPGWFYCAGERQRMMCQDELQRGNVSRTWVKEAGGGGGVGWY